MRQILLYVCALRFADSYFVHAEHSHSIHTEDVTEKFIIDDTLNSHISACHNPQRCNGSLLRLLVRILEIVLAYVNPKLLHHLWSGHLDA